MNLVSRRYIDGQRFLIRTETEDSELRPINVIFNWPLLLENKAR